MDKQLDGKIYIQRIQNVAYLCLGVPLVFFIYLYLESSVDQLEAKIPQEYQMILFIPLFLIALAIIIFSIRTYRLNVGLARQTETFREKLTMYQKASHQRFLSYGISASLITFGFYLTNFQAFAALFGIMIVLFSINNPSSRKIVSELRLQDNEKKAILEGLDIN